MFSLLSSVDYGFRTVLSTLIIVAIPASRASSLTTCWRGTTCTGPLEPSFPGSWEINNFSPSSRTVSPISVLNPNHTVISKFPDVSTLAGNGSLLVYDFGQEVGGIVTVTYNATGIGALGIAFSEASNFTGEWSDSSDGAFVPDGALYSNITAPGRTSYTMPDDRLRGGFRYLSLFSITNSTINITITDIGLEIAFQPAWSNLRAYGGYFHSNDALLNKIWYTGAYTLQTNSVPPNTGREFPLVPGGWLNNATLGNGSTIMVDGSKRDRSVWAGDLGIALPSVFISTGDTDGAKNSLQVQYDNQNPATGELPMVGPPISFYGSDTYHMSTLIGTYEYVLFTNDTTFFNTNWAKYKLAMVFITAKIDSTSLLEVTGTGDWGRLTQGGHNSEAQMLLYRVLTTGSVLATWMEEASTAANWTSTGEALKSAINALNFDPSVGSFKNSDTDASIYPQDANSMALLYNTTNSTSRALSTSTQLTKNWTPIGPNSPELPDNVVPFIGSFEVQGHLNTRQTLRALELIRTSWGWYANNPFGTNSTNIEGYLINGTFGYRGNSGYDFDDSYPSHAHGWSTGPTYALTTFVLGLSVTAPMGTSWSLAPQFGDLTSVEGGFTTPLGKFQAAWAVFGNGSYVVSYNVPEGTSGMVALPAENATGMPRILLDGVVVNMGGLVVDEGTETVVVEVEGGNHTFMVVL